MSGRSRSTPNTANVGAPAAQAATAHSASAPATSNASTAEEVVLYLTLNNTTHNKDELPETLAALKQAEHEGLGHRELLAISDPYWTKDSKGKLTYDEGTYDGVFGASAAGRVDWWHGDEALEPGQVRVDGEILTLGTSDVKSDDVTKQAEIQSNWRKTLMELGMPEEKSQELVDAVLKDGKGNWTGLDSGDGATNELIQFAMAMHRAEEGEIDVKTVVFSGHHWDEDNRPGQGQGIWGEVPGQGHTYDDTEDYFSLSDVKNMKDVFPAAFGQVKSVQIAACNSDSLGMTNAQGEDLTTNQFLDSVFENVDMVSYMKEELAPLAKDGAETNGEFVLDAMRYENGTDRKAADAAAKDSRHNLRGLKRSLRNKDGDLEEIRMKTKKSSYVGSAPGLGDGARKDGLRDQNTLYTDRADLEDWLKNMTSLPEQTAPTRTPTDPTKI